MLSFVRLETIIRVQEEPIFDWWLRVRKLLPKDIRRGFDSLFFLVGWLLRKERNSRTFKRRVSSPAQLLQAIKDEAAQWCSAGFH